jgi:glycosyltransferase involved in cell wall biosynthesis
MGFINALVFFSYNCLAKLYIIVIHFFKNFLNLINTFVSKVRLPWFLKVKIDEAKNVYFYSRNKLFFRRKSRSKSPKKAITFKCGFHGKTGAVSSIANIANILTEVYDVDFISFPKSNFNKYLNKNVKITQKVNFESDLFICDLSCDHDFLEQLKSTNKKIIMSCHGMLYSQFGLKAEHKLKSVKYAVVVQFVSAIQQQEYQLAENRYVVIPNTVVPVNKSNVTQNVGTVGNLNLVNKNVNASVDIAMASKANEIHLWSIEQDYWNSERVVVHDWEMNRERIYNSFDVLVFMSLEEALSMVVLEALSAGIPCLLSNIPAFQQFSDTPGVFLVDPQDIDAASTKLNELLLNKADLKADILKYWRANYSHETVSNQWFEFISKQFN